MKIPVSGFQFSQKSFTLFEVLIVVAILVVLTIIALPNFRFFGKETDLNNSTEEIINVLRLAQNKTLASEGPNQYGVHFETDKFVLFEGTTYNPLATSNETHDLPQSVEIYEIDLNGGLGVVDVVFKRLTGETDQFGTVSLRLKTDFSKTRTVGIGSSGKITLGDESAPILPLPTNTDSRHVHFDLGWSIQNATNLKFYFPSIPPEMIDTTNYFNASKTEFDWEGKFTVSGVDQVFRIHSHSLDAFNTLLCIHRDRNQGKNNQEVIIYIVDSAIDKDIAHYLADSNDTVLKGSYVNNTMERQ